MVQRNFDASKGKHVDMIKVSTIEWSYYVQFSSIILVLT